MGSTYPLTTFERGMYIEQKLNEKSTAYNLNILLSIKGREASEVKDALNAVFAANEAFHSYYGEENGIPVRILTDRLPVIEEKNASSFEEVKAIADSFYHSAGNAGTSGNKAVSGQDGEEPYDRVVADLLKFVVHGGEFGSCSKCQF